MQKPKESDWKLFGNSVDNLREWYLEAKNRELMGLLSDPRRTATEQFWDTLERMKAESKILQDCLDGHSRSNMFMAMALMRHHGMLTNDDLQRFSPDLQQDLARYLKIMVEF